LKVFPVFYFSAAIAEKFHFVPVGDVLESASRKLQASSKDLARAKTVMRA